MEMVFKPTVENLETRHPISMDLWRCQSNISPALPPSCALSDQVKIDKNLVNLSQAPYKLTQYQHH